MLFLPFLWLYIDCMELLSNKLNDMTFNIFEDTCLQVAIKITGTCISWQLHRVIFFALVRRNEMRNEKN